MSAALRSRITERSKVNAEDCWVWQRALLNGYGRIAVDRQTRYAHRVSYEAFHGPIPDGYVVMHTCDNRQCVNPQHLVVGTPRDNALDMVAKQRHPMIGHLSDEIVLEILRRYADGEPQAAIAVAYGTSQQTVSQYVQRRRRAHLT